MDARSADAFYKAIRTYWPGLPDGALKASYAGIRPKVCLQALQLLQGFSALGFCLGLS